MTPTLRWAAALPVAALLLATLAGCVAVPYPEAPQQQQPYVAVPGPAKTEAAFHQDDAFCRNRPQPQAADGTQLPPGIAYLQCMEARNNTIQPLAPQAPPLYAYQQAYPVFVGYGPALAYGYGYPYFGPGLGIGFGFGFGFHGGYGGYRGGYGFRGGYGGYRGGYGGGYGGYRGGGDRGHR